jgi:hypothetical protein
MAVVSGAVIVSIALAVHIRQAHARPSKSAPAQVVRGVINLSANLGSGVESPFNNFECANVSRQFRIDRSITRGGAPSARFEERPGDVWQPNGTVRCLVADYSSGETSGNDYYFGFSIYVPTGAANSGNLVWALHQSHDLYQHPECAVAPYAVHFETRGRREGLYFRVVGGNCVLGRGWSLWRPNIRLRGLDPVPRDTWIDLLVHIRFDESPNGVVEVWSRRAGAAWPRRAAVFMRKIPTLPRCDVCPVHDTKLYTTFGLYTGSSSTKVVSVVYISGYRRGTTFDVVKSGFPAR